MILRPLLGTALAILIATSCANGQSTPTGGPDATGPNTDSSIGDALGTNKDVGVDAPRTPKLNPNWPPYSLTWTSAGAMGRAGGLTWTYTGIQHTGLSHIWWIVCDDPAQPCGLSLDGPIQSSALWAFDATNSNLLSGKLVFTNTTGILLADATTRPLSGRLTVTIVDSGNAPIPFATVVMLGVTARDGKYGVEIKSAGYTVVALAEVKDTITNTWTPYDDYYDAQQTPGDAGLNDAGGNAYTSFGASFYDE